MRSPFYFIVTPAKGKRYDNTIDIGDSEVIVSTSEEDFKFSNRVAIVKALPLGYSGDVKIGSKMIVHHNVFKFYNDMKGRRKSGKSYFKDDLFFVDFDQFYMYNSGGGWVAHGKYCFVAPVKAEESYILKSTSSEPLIGVVRYPNEYLLSKGVKSGDRVSFKPDSEYEFLVDGEKMFRMYDSSITMRL